MTILNREVKEYLKGIGSRHVIFIIPSETSHAPNAIPIQHLVLDETKYGAKVGEALISIEEGNPPTEGPSVLPPGPYALVSGGLLDAWKIVDDTNGTCMATFKPQST